MKKMLVVLCSAVLFTGCSTYSASRYSISADNVTALRSHNGKTINVGPFTATKLGETEIMCRAVGPIKTPDGEPFSDFVRKALIDEMKIANIYSQAAPITLTGNLDSVGFSSGDGAWILGLTVKSSNGKSLFKSEAYSYATSFYGETACNQTAQAFMPAVQNLIGRIVGSPDFATLISE